MSPLSGQLLMPSKKKGKQFNYLHAIGLNIEVITNRLICLCLQKKTTATECNLILLNCNILSTDVNCFKIHLPNVCVCFFLCHGKSKKDLCKLFSAIWLKVNPQRFDPCTLPPLSLFLRNNRSSVQQ